MALIIQLFGEFVLTLPKERVVDLLVSSPLLTIIDKKKALREWSEATGIALAASDFEKIEASKR